MINNELLKFDLEVLLRFKPEYSKDPSPSDSIYMIKKKLSIQDFAQCDECYIAILLSGISVIVVDRFTQALIYSI